MTEPGRTLPLPSPNECVLTRNGHAHDPHKFGPVDVDRLPYDCPGFAGRTPYREGMDGSLMPTSEGREPSFVWCSGDECLEQWPEGPLPAGWTVENVEGRIEPCCADCTAFYAAEAAPANPPEVPHD